MEEEIRSVMAMLFEVDKSAIDRKTTQADVAAWDSINHLNLIVELEAKYNIQFEPDEISNMTTFEAVCDMVNSKMNLS